MVAAYPAADDKAVDTAAERVMQALIDIIHSIRNVRAQYRVESGKRITARIYAGELAPTLTPYAATIQALARVKPAILPDEAEPTPGEKVVLLEGLGVDVYQTARNFGYPINVLPDYDQQMNRYALILVE